MADLKVNESNSYPRISKTLECKAKSSFYQEIEAQVKEYTPVLERLAQIIQDFVPANETEMKEFRIEIEDIFNPQILTTPPVDLGHEPDPNIWRLRLSLW